MHFNEIFRKILLMGQGRDDSILVMFQQDFDLRASKDCTPTLKAESLHKAAYSVLALGEPSVILYHYCLYVHNTGGRHIMWGNGLVDRGLCSLSASLVTYLSYLIASQRPRL